MANNLVEDATKILLISQFIAILIMDGVVPVMLTKMHKMEMNTIGRPNLAKNKSASFSKLKFE